MTAVVRARIDEETKEQAAEILSRSGLTISDAIRITLNRIVAADDFVLVPNKVTAKTIRDGRKGKNVFKADNVDDLFKQMKKWK